MKALVEKEIRMLLPAFVGALVLAIVPDWLFQYDRWSSRDYSVYFLGFGVALLALSSFGREIGLRTLPFMLAQPLDRSRIWRAKGGVLGFFVAVTFIGWWLSRALSSFFQPVPEQGLAEAWAFVAVMVAGALWMTLLLRQVAAAFWLTLLVPMVTAIFVRAIGGNDWVVVHRVGTLCWRPGLFLASTAIRRFAGHRMDERNCHPETPGVRWRRDRRPRCPKALEDADSQGTETARIRAGRDGRLVCGASGGGGVAQSRRKYFHPCDAGDAGDVWLGVDFCAVGYRQSKRG